MTNIQKIEKEISQLRPDELAEFRSWFEKYDAEVWDRELETDVKSGKLDKLSKQAINDFSDGKFKKI